MNKKNNKIPVLGYPFALQLLDLKSPPELGNPSGKLKFRRDKPCKVSGVAAYNEGKSNMI